MSKLAINGGKPVRTKLFPRYNTMGAEEKAAIARVMDTGVLSQFLGSWHEDFYGGPEVQQFEADFAALAGTKFAVSVNSNTSGLYAAVGACKVGPGDEVIVSPYTMTASAVAPYIYGGVPVFADIDPRTYCITPESIEARITPRTKAILAVHIFGHPADMDEIMAIARRHNIKVIEDCAQAPGIKYKGRPVGSIGDMGIFSLNYHKHVHTGEGGVITTNDPVLAEKCQLIRNHGEEVVEKKGTQDLENTFGFNYRLTEPHAAIGIEQLKKLPGLMAARQQKAQYLISKFAEIPGFTPPLIKDGSEHAFYLMATRFDPDVVGVERNRFIDAVKAEIPSAEGRETTPILGAGYVRPLYLQPIYQQRLGRCSFNCPRYEGDVSYDRGLCPTAERMHFVELFTNEFIRPSMEQSDLDDVVTAFRKVYDHRHELAAVPAR